MSDTDFVVDKDNLEVRASRVFAASPERLWEACIDPAQIAEWWGPEAMKTNVEKFDLVIGGQWRIVQTDPAGQVHAFRGEFKEIDEPNKMSRTFEYEPVPGHVMLETMDLEPQPDGKTKFTATARYDNLADMESMVSMGMEEGLKEGLERMAKLVEKAE